VKKPIALILTLALLGCSSNHPVWYLDTVATEGGEPGKARALIETIYGRTEWTIENGVLYVGDDSSVPRAIWGANDAQSPVAEEDQEAAEEPSEPAAEAEEAAESNGEPAVEPAGDPV
jgi:hypothetical protein